jgi:diguanylate cyclase (GGDEF)-like protein/PAS domain S-box-containing protein
MDGNDGMQLQMFRYAQDLQELMGQQTRLQKRYQLLLHSLGRGSLGQDRLQGQLLAWLDRYLVTNLQGEFLRASPALSQAMHASAAAWTGPFIQDMVPPDQAPRVQALLSTLAVHGEHGPIQRRQLVLRDDAASPQGRAYDALIHVVNKHDHLEVHWLLGCEVPPGAPEGAIHAAFLALGDSEDGLLLVGQDGNIQALNSAVTRITGYSQAELQGQNPHTFSSEFHDADFYPDLWDQLLRTGSWTGELFNRRKNGQVYLSWESIKAVKNASGDTVSYIASFTDMSPDRIDTRELTHLAFHDHLTGLPNRRMLEDRLQQALLLASEAQSGLSVLVLDLNGFKPINDALGHDVGDLVLQAVGSRLQVSVRRVDICARVGGDEFVVVLHGTHAEPDVERIASGILAAISAPIDLGKRVVSVGASMGCARFPRDAQNMTTLLKHADTAMYRAKRAGSKLSFYADGHD